MDRRPRTLLLAGSVVWGILVLVLIVYLFFPYQKAVKVALQNMVGGGRAAVSMERVGTRTIGIKAARLLIQPDPGSGQTPFEVSDINITVKPLSLFKGCLSIHSTASLYDGVLQSAVDGIQLMGSSNPAITLTLRNVNMARVPEGTIPWLKSVSGILDGRIEKHPSAVPPDRQLGSFKLRLKRGEINDLQIKGMPRLVVPYEEITAEGKVDGPRIDVTRLAFTSSDVTIHGSGAIDSTEGEPNIDMRLSYRSLSKTFPLRGQGNMRISGNQSAPIVVLSEANKDAQTSPAGSFSR